MVINTVLTITAKRLKRLSLRVVYACLLLMMSFSVVVADNGLVKIYPAYIYNILRFVHWPNERFQADNSPIQICLYGEPFLEAPLASYLNNKRLLKRGFVVARIEAFNAASSDCHVLYIGSLVRGGIEGDAIEAAAQHILTIAHREDFIQQGGMVNFYLDNQKLRFEVGVDNLAKANIQVEHLLLGISRVVHTK